MSEFILLDDSLAASQMPVSHYFYGGAQHFRCDQSTDVAATLRSIEQARLTGRYVAGYIAYEAYQAFFSKACTTKSTAPFPLIHFVAFDHYQRLSAVEVKALLADLQCSQTQDTFIYHQRLRSSYAQYQQQFDVVQQQIQQGYSYQVNLTSRVDFQYQGDVIALYQLLRQQQPVHYSALCVFDDYQILSFSPELFFSKKQDRLKVSPMKGTLPRGNNDTEDQRYQMQLTKDEKSLSENLMIVDLLRNDLNRVAEPGSVVVEKLFDVEQYKTVNQMVSTICATVPPVISFDQILQALFPCGSITGAPKLSTMNIIDNLEGEARHVYTGAIGFIKPNNDMCFNVAIRTLRLQDGVGEMGVGGGVVADSECAAEYKEMKLKYQFLEKVKCPFELIECFLYHSSHGYRWLEDHLTRLANAGQVLGFVIDKKKIRSVLEDLPRQLEKTLYYKIRLVVNQSGDLNLQIMPIDCDQFDKTFSVALCEHVFSDSRNILFQYKTTAKSVRDFYDKIASEYRNQGYDEVILMNELGQITEGTRSNIFIVKDQYWFTPPLSCGVLPGVARKHIMQEKKVVERVLIKSDLLGADEVWIGNSVMGLKKVEVDTNVARAHH